MNVGQLMQIDWCSDILPLNRASGLTGRMSSTELKSGGLVGDPLDKTWRLQPHIQLLLQPQALALGKVERTVRDQIQSIGQSRLRDGEVL